MKAGIRETRNRLAAQVAQTADHVHTSYSPLRPPSLQKRPPAEWSLVAIKAIAVAGRTGRIWTDMRRTGPLRRAAIGGVIAGVAALLAVRTRRR